MKKRILTVCLVILLALTVVGCISCKDRNEQLAAQLRVVNTLLRENYSEMELTVTTQYDVATLNAKYVLTKEGQNTNIEYAVDRLNTIDVNNGLVSMPDAAVTRVVGKAVFNGSAVETIDDEVINPQVLLDVADLSVMFRVNDLSNVTVTDTNLSATVVAPKNFMNNKSFDGTEMSVDVKYSETAITSMTIKYNAADGAKVELKYVFTK